MNRSKRSWAASAVVAGLAVSGAVLAPGGTASAADNAATPAVGSGPCPAARVTGLSALLDAMATGSSAGPSVLYGIATAAFSQPLPEPIGAAQNELVVTGAEGVQQARTEAPQQFDAVREAVAPLAAGNEFANQGVDAFADALDTAATSGGKAVAPGDLTLRQLAILARTGREMPAKSC